MTLHAEGSGGGGEQEKVLGVGRTKSEAGPQTTRSEAFLEVVENCNDKLPSRAGSPWMIHQQSKLTGSCWTGYEPSLLLLLSTHSNILGPPYLLYPAFAQQLLWYYCSLEAFLSHHFEILLPAPFTEPLVQCFAIWTFSNTFFSWFPWGHCC